MSAAAAASGGLSRIFEQLGDVFSLGSGDTAVGLSIGSSSIKLVELKKAGKIWKLLHFGIVQLPDDLTQYLKRVVHRPAENA